MDVFKMRIFLFLLALVTNIILSMLIWPKICKFLLSILKSHMLMDGENFQIFKDLKITMDKYVLHSEFYSLDMDVWMLFWDICGCNQVAISGYN